MTSKHNEEGTKAPVCECVLSSACMLFSSFSDEDLLDITWDNPSTLIWLIDLWSNLLSSLESSSHNPQGHSPSISHLPHSLLDREILDCSLYLIKPYGIYLWGCSKTICLGAGDLGRFSDSLDSHVCMDLPILDSWYFFPIAPCFVANFVIEELLSYILLVSNCFVSPQNFPFISLEDFHLAWDKGEEKGGEKMIKWFCLISFKIFT